MVRGDWNEFIKACGATPVNTPFSEVYSSLQKNMYDGLMIAAETLQSCNFAEVCDYVTMINFCYMSGPGHLMNMDVYNSLPEVLKPSSTMKNSSKNLRMPTEKTDSDLKNLL